MGDIANRILSNILTSANSLRREAKLCDVVLYVQSKKGVMVGYPAHKLVLINSSRYFKGLFDRDDLSPHCHFPSLTEDGLFTLLDIIYGHEISNDTKIEDALYAAKYLQVELAVEYLEHELTRQIQLQSSQKPNVVHMRERQNSNSVNRLQQQMLPGAFSQSTITSSSKQQQHMLSGAFSKTSVTSHHSPRAEESILRKLGEMEKNHFTKSEHGLEDPPIIKVESDSESYYDQMDSQMTSQFSEHLPATTDSGHSLDSTDAMSSLNTFGIADDGSLDDSGAYQEQCDTDTKLDLSQVTNSDFNVCCVCGTQFNNLGEFREHMKTHRPKTDSPVQTSEHTCSVCGIHMFTATRLSLHLRKHTGFRPYECRTCGRKFSEAGNYRRHCQKLHGYRPLVKEFKDSGF